MQVKKFEANTIKEAIDLVKRELGPEAIILSAKENTKGYGIMGGTSIEVTAAVSEQQLRSKKALEMRLDSQSKQKFQSIPAKKQKALIESALQPNKMKFEETQRAAPTPIAKKNGITAARYIDIDEDGNEAPQSPKVAGGAGAYVGNRAQVTTVTQQQVAAALRPTEQVVEMQKEINYLRGMLEKFSKMPQTFMTMHPGADEGIPYELSFAFKKLQDAGIYHDTIVQILRHANDVLPIEHKKKKGMVDGWVIKYLLDSIQIQQKPFQKKIHVFIGPTGQGKTSMVVKTACHLILKEKKKVILLSGDNVKVGANDQFKIYGQILNVPTGLLSGRGEWQTLQNVIDNVDYVLVDTPGLTLKNPMELEMLKALLPANNGNVQTHYVQSALARDNDAFKVAERYRLIGFDDVCFTRLDEAVQHGIIYNFHKKFGVPLHSFGIGHQMPDDYELASKERVIDLLFQLSKIRKERGNHE